MFGFGGSASETDWEIEKRGQILCCATFTCFLLRIYLVGQQFESWLLLQMGIKLEDEDRVESLKSSDNLVT